MRSVVQIVVVVSVVVAAILGIVLILERRPSELLEQAAASVFSVAVAAAFTLVAVTLHASGRARPLAWSTGIALSAALAGMLWTIVADRFYSDDATRRVWSLVVIGLALGHASTLFCARLLPHFEWIRWATVLALVGLVAMLLASIWSRSSRGDRQMTAVAGLLVAAGTLLIPILHGATRRALGIVDAGAMPGVRRCPNCGHVLPADVSEVFH
jgi:FtsH-binding integral membrane protein